MVYVALVSKKALMLDQYNKNRQAKITKFDEIQERTLAYLIELTSKIRVVAHIKYSFWIICLKDCILTNFFWIGLLHV